MTSIAPLMDMILNINDLQFWCRNNEKLTCIGRCPIPIVFWFMGFFKIRTIMSTENVLQCSGSWYSSASKKRWFWWKLYKAVSEKLTKIFIYQRQINTCTNRNPSDWGDLDIVYTAGQAVFIIRCAQDSPIFDLHCWRLESSHTLSLI